MAATLIIIITKNNKNELKSLLKSIKQNDTLKMYPIVIIDDSENKVNQLSVKKVVDAQNFLNITVINKENWNRIKKQLLKNLQNVDERVVINSLNLGRHLFNTFSTLNVGILIALTSYDKLQNVLILDSDIVIPKDFDISKLHPKYLYGFTIRGSPDLSRIQWISLYIKYLFKKYNLPIKLSTRTIVDLMARKLKVYEMEIIISRYTDFYVYKGPHILKKDLDIKFPTRGIDTNVMLIPKKLLRRCLFPRWWGQQFAWFHKLRLELTDIRFSTKVLIHHARQKQILDPILNYELQGSILTEMYKKNVNFYNEDMVKKETQEQISVLNKLVKLITKIKTSSLLIGELRELNNIQSYLLHSIKHLELSSDHTYINLLTQEDKIKRIWSRLSKKDYKSSANF
ncbi:hypothetical protein A2716_00015 [candidate division WWE3 bacterium RIFCSPHIGHO2_01_FULL_40_23]|nr:MAG: hypothetical protein A2716_00015 [candidate division WWE3 bacterium RIFCSPHIGHO2_01_FULL_40_23]